MLRTVTLIFAIVFLCFGHEVSFGQTQTEKDSHQLTIKNTVSRYYKSLGDNMSEEDFYRNNQLHYSKQSNTLSDRQKSFVVDALSCYQLIEQVKQLGSNENRSSMSQESVKDTTPSKKIKDSLNKKSSK